MYSAICQICGNEFTARAKTTKYCSACVSKAKPRRRYTEKSS